MTNKKCHHHGGKKHRAERPYDNMANAAAYFRSHRDRHYLDHEDRVWTKEKRRLFRTGRKMLDDGFRIELVVNVIREVLNG